MICDLLANILTVSIENIPLPSTYLVKQGIEKKFIWTKNGDFIYPCLSKGDAHAVFW